MPATACQVRPSGDVQTPNDPQFVTPAIVTAGCDPPRRIRPDRPQRLSSNPERELGSRASSWSYQGWSRAAGLAESRVGRTRTADVAEGDVAAARAFAIGPIAEYWFRGRSVARWPGVGLRPDAAGRANATPAADPDRGPRITHPSETPYRASIAPSAGSPDVATERHVAPSVEIQNSVPVVA